MAVLAPTLQLIRRPLDVMSDSAYMVGLLPAIKSALICLHILRESSLYYRIYNDGLRHANVLCLLHSCLCPPPFLISLQKNKDANAGTLPSLERKRLARQNIRLREQKANGSHGRVGEPTHGELKQ